MSSNLNIVTHFNVNTFHSGQSVLKLERSHCCLNSIEAIIDQLKGSPFVALGRLGPSFYSEPPHQIKNNVIAQGVFGWSPHANRIAQGNAKVFLVLGAQKLESNRGVVYYTSCEFPTSGPGAYAFFRRSTIDEKIYVASFERFKEVTQSLILPYVRPYTTSSPAISPSDEEMDTTFTPAINLSDDEIIWAEKFKVFADVSILGCQKENCKNLAQEMFNEFKVNLGDSFLAKEAMERVCESLPTKGSLERAWNGVGDELVRWQA